MTKHHGKARGIKDGAHRGMRRPYATRGPMGEVDAVASDVAGRVLASDATEAWFVDVRRHLADLPSEVASVVVCMVAERLTQELCA